MDQDVMRCFDDASTISPLTKRIGQIERDLQWSLDWCKEKDKDPDVDEDVVHFREQIVKLKSIEGRAIYIDMDRGEGEYAVIDLLNLFKVMGLVESYESEY
jgi:hypothetical protein